MTGNKQGELVFQAKNAKLINESGKHVPRLRLSISPLSRVRSAFLPREEIYSVPSRNERRPLSQTAAGNRAYVLYKPSRLKLKKKKVKENILVDSYFMAHLDGDLRKVVRVS